MIAFKHSGPIDDVIYAIPTMLAYAEDARFKLYLKLYGASYSSPAVNPMSRVMINHELFYSLKALLEKQLYIEGVEIYEGQVTDVDLDLFRQFQFSSSGNASRWYEAICPVKSDLYHPWLRVERTSKWQDTIVVARSFRCRNREINYRFLSLYDRVGFVGTMDEYKDFCSLVPHAFYIPTPTLYDLAVAIQSARLFIGNQSVSFAIAEGLKVPRILECCHSASYIIPFNNGYGVFVQNHLEQLVDNFLSMRPAEVVAIDNVSNGIRS